MPRSLSGNASVMNAIPFACIPADPIPCAIFTATRNTRSFENPPTNDITVNSPNPAR